jgi:DNA-binding PadR family transcriptional regulator
MENLILGLLILKQMTIYELNSSFKEGLSLIYSASYGSLQSAVKKLLKHDMITYEEQVENGRNKKIYHIKETGKDKFYKWMQEEIPEKKLEVMILSKIYFLGLIENKEDQVLILDKMIAKVSNIYNEMQTYEKEINTLAIPKKYEAVAKFQIRTLNYGVNSHLFALNWLKTLRDEIVNDLI